MFLLCATGCDDTPVESVTPPALHCDEDAPSYLLRSKLDDDDGEPADGSLNHYDNITSRSAATR